MFMICSMKGEKKMIRKSGLRADYRQGEPFYTAEEAWLWCCWCETHKGDRGRFSSARRSVARPCEASDILIVLKRLVWKGILKQYHVRVLSKYGLEQMPPHISFGASFDECRLWRDALFVMEPILISKGIVQPDEDDFSSEMYLQCNYH